MENSEEKEKLVSFDKNIYDKITEVFAKRGLRRKDAPKAYGRLADLRDGLECAQPGETCTRRFVSGLVDVISDLAEAMNGKRNDIVVVTGAFDESGRDRYGPEALIVKTFSDDEEGRSKALDAYRKYAMDLDMDLKSDESFDSSHDIYASGFDNISIDGNEIRCGRVLTDSGLHTGFAAIKRVDR